MGFICLETVSCCCWIEYPWDLVLIFVTRIHAISGPVHLLELEASTCIRCLLDLLFPSRLLFRCWESAFSCFQIHLRWSWNCTYWRSVSIYNLAELVCCVHCNSLVYVREVIQHHLWVTFLNHLFSHLFWRFPCEFCLFHELRINGGRKVTVSRVHRVACCPFLRVVLRLGEGYVQLTLLVLGSQEPEVFSWHDIAFTSYFQGLLVCWFLCCCPIAGLLSVCFVSFFLLIVRENDDRYIMSRCRWQFIWQTTNLRYSRNSNFGTQFVFFLLFWWALINIHAEFSWRY